MKRDGEYLADLLDAALTFRGRRVVIESSLSRNRNVGGHDRHFATRSRMCLVARYVDTPLSGMQLVFDDGDGMYYGVTFDAVTSYTLDDSGTLEIVEQFESETERRTRLSLAGEQGVAIVAETAAE